MEDVDTYLGAAGVLGVLKAKKAFNTVISINGTSNDLKKIGKRINLINLKMRKMEEDFRVYLEEDDIIGFRTKGDLYAASEQESEEIRMEAYYRPAHVVYDTKAFTNLTKYLIPSDVALALSWGPKFTFPYILNKNNIHKYLAQLECTIENTVPIAVFDLVGREIAQHLIKLDEVIHSTDIQWLLFVGYRLEKFLKEHNDAKPILADKGKITVLIYLKDYEQMIHEHLSNELHYCIVDSNPLAELVKGEGRLIQTLKDNEFTAHLINCYQDKCMELPKFYGTIKIHKNNAIRPITSAAGNTVGAKINGAFNKILTVVFPPKERHCKNAKDLKNRIANIVIQREQRMVSFDAVSMFTSIPAPLIIDIIMNKAELFERLFHINAATLWNLTSFVLLECTFFTALGKIFRQKHGLPMGGAISTICCRLIMDFILDKTLEMIDRPIFHGVYVDDTFFIMEETQIQPTLLALNSADPNLVFTVEIEERNRLNFLNITIHREANGYITNWYKKDIASNRILNYFSSHKRSTIINTAVQFIKTVLELSDADFFQENKKRIELTLTENCFPECIRIVLLQENYTLMRPIMYSAKNLDKKYVSFPHQILNGPVKGIIRSYKNTNAVLTESIKNNKINFIRNIKTKTDPDGLTNVILLADCQCKAKMKIQMTGFNQTAGALREHMQFGEGKCTTKMHVFNVCKTIRGLHTAQQTRCYMRYLQFRHRSHLLDLFQFPNKHLRRVMDKFT